MRFAHFAVGRMSPIAFFLSFFRPSLETRCQFDLIIISRTRNWITHLSILSNPPSSTIQPSYTNRAKITYSNADKKKTKKKDL